MGSELIQLLPYRFDTSRNKVSYSFFYNFEQIFLPKFLTHAALP